MTDALQLWGNAKFAIEQCRTIDEVKDIRDKAEALRAYAKQSGESLEVQNNVSEIKLRCDKKIGEISKALPTSNGKRTDITSPHNGERLKTEILKEAGINHPERYEAIANLPDELFEEYIENVKESNEELTSSGILKAARNFEQEKKKDEAEVTLRDRTLISDLKNGITVVVNQKTDLATIKWAESNNLYIRADRFSEWGNPFEMGKDGSRNEVCNNYNKHYLPFKPSLLSKVKSLKGKALGCWCAPERCHCDKLKELADEG
jgi:hypothetical protein